MLDHQHSNHNLSILLPEFLALNAINKQLAVHHSDHDPDRPSLSPPSDAASSASDQDNSLSPPPSALSPPPFSAALSYPHDAAYDDPRRSPSYHEDLYAHRPTTAGSTVSNNPPTPASQQYQLPYHDIPYNGVRTSLTNQQHSPASPNSELVAFNYSNRSTAPNHRLSLDPATAASSSYAFDRRLSEPNSRFRPIPQQQQAAGNYPSLPSLSSLSSSLPSSSPLQHFPSHHLSSSLHHPLSSSYPNTREDAFAAARKHSIASATDDFSPRPGPARHYTYPSSAQGHSQWSEGYSSESEERRQSIGGNGILGDVAGPLTTEPMASAVMTATSAVAAQGTGLSVGLGIGMEGNIVGDLANVGMGVDPGAWSFVIKGAYMLILTAYSLVFTTHERDGTPTTLTQRSQIIPFDSFGQ